ncbi:hypothetical protein JL2886_00166 [Phaeobacter gallaeciensis]|uniref:Uncharacterized protein n=1 Tax=Phaeobacter gallaeciensis TaxID=60890 RepID=A0A1B0ZLU3_9RHOB|nr:hypothetical protein JL2886_00166 [Phaeobacter gallaeciensis]
MPLTHSFSPLKRSLGIFGPHVYKTPWPLASSEFEHLDPAAFL